MAYCNKPIIANIFCSRSVAHTILINVKKAQRVKSSYFLNILCTKNQ